MASTHMVILTTIDEIKPHDNADKLELAVIGGWQVVTGIGNHTKGDRIVFVPIDSIIPDEWSIKWDVKQYLGGKGHVRVRIVKLRGEPSYGFIVPVPDELQDKKNGTDVKDFFGITKYEPPKRREKGSGSPQGQPRKNHPLLPKYTGIENLRNFMGVFQDGELVSITEKIHGRNFRASLLDTEVNKKDFWSRVLRFLHIKNRTEIIEEFVSGSHNVQRKIPEDPSETPYTFPMGDEYLVHMLRETKGIRRAQQVVVFGEVFGPKDQKLDYGVKDREYRVFDILIDGHYIDCGILQAYCKSYNVPIVPELYRGPFSVELVKDLGEGKTTINGATHIREGVIVKPLKEARTRQGGRKILKLKGAGYEMWKASGKGSDYTEE